MITEGRYYTAQSHLYRRYLPSARNVSLWPGDLSNLTRPKPRLRLQAPDVLMIIHTGTVPGVLQLAVAGETQVGYFWGVPFMTSSSVLIPSVPS